MCGRTAYSACAICAAATALADASGSSCARQTLIRGKEHEELDIVDGNTANSKESSLLNSPHNISIQSVLHGVEDRPNTGPGNAYHIFRRSKSEGNGRAVECLPGAVWGLIPRNGTNASPHLLPTDPNFSVSPHYAMFNCRSETIYEKQSFSGLIRNGQTCILAVEGYYEWTKSQSSDKRKQPYFVRYKDKQCPMLLAGLWSCVKTGRRIKSTTNSNIMKDETITTFAILTTDSHPKYEWLHPRQPVILWDNDIAVEWLMRPSPATVDKLRTVPIKGDTTKNRTVMPIWETSLSVYPVSKRINDGKYQGGDCTVEVKLEKSPNIKSFFSPGWTKRARTDMKAKSGKKLVPFNQEPNVTPEPHRYPSSEQKDSSSKIDIQSSMLKDAPHGDRNKETCWTCKSCTYIHSGPTKSDYLACEMCGTERSDGQNPDCKKRKAVH